jgi:hypothetical protein
MRTRSRLLAVPFAAALLFGSAACSDDDQDAIDETIDDVRADADETMDDLQEGAEDIRSDVSDAIDEGTQDAVELAARNLAARQGADEFDSNGIDVDGDLDCEATAAGDNTNLEVMCTGTSTEGQDLAIEGTTTEMPGASLTELEGTFTGTADGEEVFSVDTLGG